MTIHQDVDLFAAKLKPGEGAKLVLKPDRKAWLQVAKGEVTLGTLALKAGDGAGLIAEPEVAITATADAQVLLFDLV